MLTEKIKEEIAKEAAPFLSREEISVRNLVIIATVFGWKAKELGWTLVDAINEAHDL